MSWLRIVTINLIVFGIVLGALEVIVRITNPEYVNAYFDDNTTWGKPIYRNRVWGHRVGRDQIQSPLTRMHNENRVLFIGDSVTFGYGVDFSEIYYEMAGRLLAESGCGAVIHGAAQYNTNLKELMNSDLRSFILDGFGANIVIYQFNVNDLDFSNLPKKPADAPLSWRERFEKFRLSYLNRSAFLKFVQSWSIRNFQKNHPQKLQDSLRYSPLPDSRGYAAAWESFEETIVDVNNTLRKRGIRFAVLLVPESFQISQIVVDNDVNADASGITRWPNEIAVEIMMRHHIPVFDSLSALREYRTRDADSRLYFPNDQNHPNQLGHAVIGTSVAEFLKNTLKVCSQVSAEIAY